MLKVVFWGIDDIILNEIRNEINPFNVEIAGFIDSNCEKWGKKYMNITVSSPEQLRELKFDYVFVAALSAYEEIREILLKAGVMNEKIYPLVKPSLTTYFLGSIDNGIYKVIEDAYFEPKYMKLCVESYEEQYGKYIEARNSVKEGEKWFLKGDLISHACGGFVDGKKMMYSNSREALMYSFDQGFQLIECDVLGIEWGKVVLAHDYLNFYEAREKNYSMMLIEDVLEEIAKHPEVNLLIDVKWRSCEEYSWYVKYINDAIYNMAISQKDKESLKKQIVLEVYNEDTIKVAYYQNFKMFFTQYRNEEAYSFLKTVTLCLKYGIEVVGFDIVQMLGEYAITKFLKIFKMNNIKIYCFSTDSVEDYKNLKETGVKGVFTNYIKPSDITISDRM